MKEEFWNFSFTAIEFSEVTMSTIHWGEWERSQGCREWMDKTLFQGANFSGIFWDAMGTLFENKKREPGLLPQGIIYRHAEKLMQGREPIGFTLDSMKRILYFGEFNLKNRGKLFFTGPMLPEHKDSYAAAEINGNHVWFNFYNLVVYANENFSTAPNGVDRLKWMTMGVILHEVMHCEGFVHNIRSGNSLDSPYWRTLPEIARLATMAASPYTDAFFLDGNSAQSGVKDNLCCGTNS